MVELRKGCCYRKLERPYTRKSKFKSKGYIKAMPNHKISRFNMGDSKKKYDFKLKMVSKDTLQIRHNALESSRVIVNRNLQRTLGTNYCFFLNLYPHHGLRENKMLGGAHADRLQKGMGHPFGRVIGTAAQVKVGKTLFTALVYKGGLESAKVAFKTAFSRLPGRFSLEVEPILA